MNSIQPMILKNGEDVLRTIRLKVMQFTLNAVLVITIIGTVFGLPGIIQNNEWNVLIPVMLFAGFSSGLAIIKQFSFNLRSFCLLLIFYLLGLAGYLKPDLAFDGRLALLAFILLANILRGTGYGIFASIIASITVLFFGWFSTSAAIDNLAAYFTTGQMDWLGSGIAFTIYAMIITVGLSSLQNTMFTSLQEQFQENRRLTNQNKSLDNQAQEQYRIINQNAGELSIYRSVSAQIKNSNEIAQVFGKILETAINSLNFTFAGFYLIDDRNDYAVLKEGTGDVGRTLVESNFRVKLSENGLVTQAFQFKEAKVIKDTVLVDSFIPTPLMAATRAEAAIPVLKQERVIGVLDIQSDRPHEFTTEQIHDLEWLAGQISICMEIVSLEKQMGGLRAELNNVYHQITRQSWRTHLKLGPRNYSYRYKRSVMEKNISEPPEVTQVFNNGETLLLTGQTRPVAGQSITTIAIPIKLRNQLLGVLDIKLDANRLPQDMLPVLEAACSRLAVALENARLLEEIQNKADREHLVSDISTKIRGATNVDHVLKTTAEEIGRSFGISEVLVQLRPSITNLG